MTVAYKILVSPYGTLPLYTTHQWVYYICYPVYSISTPSWLLQLVAFTWAINPALSLKFDDPSQKISKHLRRFTSRHTKELRLSRVKFRFDVNPGHVDKRDSLLEASKNLADGLPFLKPYNGYRSHSGDVRNSITYGQQKPCAVLCSDSACWSSGLSEYNELN